MSRSTHDAALDHHGTAVAEQIATGTATAGLVPVSAGPGVSPAWGSGGGGGGVTDFITGDDSQFTASLGAWANSGGTMTRDTTAAYRWWSASLKLVTTATGQYAELPITGTFKSGVQYQCMVAVLAEEAGQVYLDIAFGLIGTDAVTLTGQVVLEGSNPAFATLVVNWTPSADRTGVKARVTRNASTSGTKTVHVGWALCRDSDGLYDAGLSVLSDRSDGPSVTVWGTTAGAYIRSRNVPGNATLSGLQLAADGRAYLNGTDQNGTGNPAFVGVDAYDNVSVYGGGGFSASSLSGKGLNVEVGPDYVGLQISEKDASTIQVYDDAGGAYDIEFVEQSSSHHVKFVASDGRVAIPAMGLVPQLAADPAVVAGMVYFNTTSHTFRGCDGTVWGEIALT